MHHIYKYIYIYIYICSPLLFNNGETWIKKDDEENFDVSVGCLDGGEVCELTGTYLLHQLIDIIPKKHLGLYRDDGLGTANNFSGSEKERIKKQIVRIFKINGLNITIKTNLKQLTSWMFIST